MAPTLYPPDMLLSGLPFAAYLADPAVNAGLLSEVSRSCLHGVAYLAQPNRVATEQMRLGKLFHAALLEPEVFAANARCFSGDRRGSTYRQLLAERGTDEWLLSEGQLETIRAMLDQVVSHPIVGPLLHRSAREVSIKWTDPMTGMVCKGRPDVITAPTRRRDPASRLCLDVKTCADAGLDAMSREIKSRHVHLQAAHYLAFGQHTGMYAHDSFGLICVERTAPYSVGYYTLGPYTLQWGAMARAAALRAWAQATREGVYPGYADEAVIEAATYALPEELRRQRFEDERADVARSS